MYIGPILTAKNILVVDMTRRVEAPVQKKLTIKWDYTYLIASESLFRNKLKN